MVHIVGAGPGDPDLITIKGHRLLSEADVVIYAGSLINEELLKICKPEAEIYNSAQMMLEEILHVISLAEKAGKTTVRLHTGDPSIYGAIQEQMDAMEARGIEFDITPGVSSFLAAAAGILVAGRHANRHNHAARRQNTRPGHGSVEKTCSTSNDNVYLPVGQFTCGRETRFNVGGFQIVDARRRRLQSLVAG